MSDLDKANKRFWKMVDPDGEDVFGMAQKCWRWRGAFDEKGRPRLKIDGKSMNANRAFCLLSGHDFQTGECVVTLCRQNGCVNPAHHVVGSIEDVRNVTDAQLEPFYQSVLRGAYAARKIKLENVVEGYKISAPVAQAILHEEFNHFQHPLLSV